MKKTLLILSALIITTIFASCSTLKEIPEEKTQAQILQMGQDCVSYGNYRDAAFCFNTAIERFGANPASYAEAKYELAHVYSKQKKYEKAYAIYTELLDIYSATPGIFSPSYKKLCEIGISNIPENRLKEIQAAENAD